MESVFQSLPFKDYDYIMYQLKQLQIAKGNASSCDQCKNKIRFAKKLIEDEPEHAHLTNMMLYKDCTLGSTPYLYCTILDFFLTTKAYTEDKVGVNAFDSSVDGYQVVNFYDNDFLHFIKEFNVSNDFEVEYYCAFSAGQCELPDVESVVESFNIDSWWPEKKPEHYYEPIYKNQNRERFNVLHMSDAHIQFTYEQGAEANCSQLVCGLKKSFNEELLGKDYNFTTAFALENPNSRIQDFQFSFYPDAHYDGVEYIKGDYYDFPKYRGWNFNSQPATVFGGYLTDTPEILVNNSLIDMTKLHKDLNFEFALYSGDTAEHDLQSVTAQLVKEEEVHFFKTVRSYLGNISVLPSLGNHDTYVYSRMAPMKLDFNHSYSWNSDEMVDVFINNGWVDASDEQVMKSHYAGFSHVTPRGLKIITLNSNTYYDTNTWAFLNTSNDPDLFGNWKFLVEELVESEAKGQRVWINAHVPPNGADALPIDSLIFKKILQRFAPYTIANIFYGHTHNDELIVAYSPNDSAIGANEPITNAWVIQSLTPFGQHNPAYRYYEVEDESFNIIQSHNYYTPLNETYVNGGAEPAWVYEYSARDAYDPQHEWPSDAPLNATFWDKFVVEKLKDPSNIEFNQLYSNYWYRFSPYTPNCTHPAGGNITKACYNSNYCFAANIDTLARSKCLMK
ncbi:Smpd1 Sphingomyelin phosphodiesterase [Candida maltosa Xu316]